MYMYLSFHLSVCVLCGCVRERVGVNALVLGFRLRSACAGLASSFGYPVTPGDAQEQGVVKKHSVDQ